jgi:hypothetical protein
MPVQFESNGSGGAPQGYFTFNASTQVNSGVHAGTLASGCATGIAFCVNSGSSFKVDTSGNATAASLTAATYVGPASAPSGSCTQVGAWVFSQDGHATFCASGTWVTKI